jgi:hypothetical protein
MNTRQKLRRFACETHACAMQMMENAAFIQKELPPLEMSDSLRQQIEKLCVGLIAAKRDLIYETHELDEFLVSATYQIEPWMERINRWIAAQVEAIHRCVQATADAVASGTANSLVSMLLMESASNILNATPATFEIEDAAEIAQGEPSADDCYAFNAEDSYPVGQLVGAIRRVMKRPELSPEESAQLRVFLFAMERLPLVTPGVRMSVGLRLDQGGESDWIEIRIEDGTFTLGRGSWIDGDADTETDFEVGPDYRDGDAFQASNFAQSFQSRAEDVCRAVVIEDTSDEPFNGWDLEKGKSRWGSLPCSFL